MTVFYYILILLAAVLLSHLVNRFIPLLSVPIVQIMLGITVAVIPFGFFGFDFELEPELFFILFLAPLVFHSTMTADKTTMRKMLKPIVLAAVGLVFVTILLAGVFSYWLIPAIPLAVAFALAAALGPTDVVAVEAVTHRVHLPQKIMSILSGESIINDATGIVCFQFAIVAVATGSFNLLHGLGHFIVLAFGGLLVGVSLTALKYLLVRWLFVHDMATPSLHIAIGIITPFIVYMVAEGFGTSGILAVFGSGIIHSLFRDKFNPETINLDMAQEHVWSVLSFSLDGLVFVMLGTQLPGILYKYISGTYEIDGLMIIGYALPISIILMLIRFVWWVLTVKRKTYDDPLAPMSKIRSGLIFSVAGARGAVPLASVFSIPFFLPSGEAFPQREPVILVASGVIVISLLVTNFILPLLVKEADNTTFNKIEQTARIEILLMVARTLKQKATPYNFTATEIVVRNYYSRISSHPNTQKRRRLNDILTWEKDVVLHMAEMEQMSKSTAERFLKAADKLKPLQFFVWMFRQFKNPSRIAKQGNPADDYRIVLQVAAKGFEIELALINEMLEANRLSEKTAKEMQANIALLEAQLQAE